MNDLWTDNGRSAEPTCRLSRLSGPLYNQHWNRKKHNQLNSYRRTRVFVSRHRFPFFPIFCCTLFFIDWLNIHHLFYAQTKIENRKKKLRNDFMTVFRKPNCWQLQYRPGSRNEYSIRKNKGLASFCYRDRLFKCRHILYFFYHFSSKQVSKWATEIHPEGSSVPHCCPLSLKYLTPPRRLTCG